MVRAGLLQSRRVLAWMALAFLLLLVLLTALLETTYPELYDVEHPTRLKLLRQRLTEKPGQPLCLTLGTSRAALALLPEQLETVQAADGREVIVFNFSHFGSSPAMQWMELKRLYQAGIRPDWVILDLVPAYLTARDDNFVASHAGGRDLLVLHPFMQARKLYPKYLRRMVELSPRYPAYLLGLEPRPTFPLARLGGYLDLKEHIDEQTRTEKTAVTVQLMKGLVEKQTVSPRPGRLLKECLAFCRKHGAKVAVLLMPEGSQYRSWYTPEGEQRLADFLGEIRNLGADVIDARTWLEDGYFYDEHHVGRAGAERFTRLFGERVLPRVIGNRGQLAEHRRDRP